MLKMKHFTPVLYGFEQNRVKLNKMIVKPFSLLPFRVIQQSEARIAMFLKESFKKYYSSLLLKAMIFLSSFT